MADPLTIAAVTAGANAIGQGANAYAQGRMNRKTREYNDSMYEKQKADSLKFWNMQNEYNSPTSQMQRLREAGLNPMLMQGGGGGSNSASPINTPNQGSWNPDTPKIDTNQITQGYFNAAIQQQQSDNLKAQNTVLLEEAELKKAQRQSLDSKTALNILDLDVNSKYSAELKKHALENLKMMTNVNYSKIFLTNAQTDAVQNNNLLFNATKDDKIAQIKAQLANTLSGTALRDAELKLKQKEYDLRKLGINPSDPTYIRIMAQYAQRWFNLD